MIYFIQDSSTGSVKIGFTNDQDAQTRLRALQTGCPSGLVLLRAFAGTREDEAALHTRFAPYRERGEWFRPAPDLLRYILDRAEDAGFKTAEASAAVKPPAPPVKPWPLNIYLAGKIQRNCWRHSVVDGLEDTGEGGSFPDDDTLRQLAKVLCTRGWPVLEQSIFGTHHYVGPYFAGSYHGTFHGDDQHGSAASVDFRAGCQHNEFLTTNLRHIVHSVCLNAIDASDVIFAWVDSLDCYGTIVELGYAAKAGKMIWIAGPKDYRDLWFVYQTAHQQLFHNMLPRSALAGFLKEYELSIKPSRVEVLQP